MLARVALLQLASASLSCVLALPPLLGDVNTAVLVRDKRDPGRSYTISSFMPGSGMSAFASSADFAPYYPRRSAQGWGPEPATVEQPPERGEANKPWTQPQDKGPERGEEEEEEEDPVTRPPKKNKKKHKPQQEDEDEEENDKPGRGSGGNAQASFNAWFPIMLGMFPGQGQGGEGFRGAGGYGARESPASRSTVIANSVSHGRSGVASSHAVLYAGGGGQGHPQGR